MIAGTTDRTRVQPCSVCGVEMEHRENFGLRDDLPTWWSPERHKAPCGAPCMGGGVRPLRAEERPPGVSGIAHSHRATACGAPGCGGGTARAIVEGAVAEYAAAESAKGGGA